MEVGGEAYPSSISSALLQGKAMLPAVSHSEAHHGRLSYASLQGRLPNGMEVGGEAYHSTVSYASLQKSTQKPMMHDREAYNGGFWYASLLGCSPNDMEGDE